METNVLYFSGTFFSAGMTQIFNEQNEELTAVVIGITMIMKQNNSAATPGATT